MTDQVDYFLTEMEIYEQETETLVEMLRIIGRELERRGEATVTGG
jgi:hypothetical protein